MKLILRLLYLSGASLLAMLATGCAHQPARPLLILVSIDGFKPAYLERGVTPRLRALASEGVRAEAMRPSFPTMTFPNHYTLVTGLHPDHHGIVDNSMEDPAIPDARFSMGNHAALTDARWWDQAEPIWVSAEKHGIRTGIMYWPGSEAPIGGVLPSHYRKYNSQVEPARRVDTVLDWLDQPGGRRPGLLSLYFEDVDSAGHDFGPDSAELNDALAVVDAAIGRLQDGLRQRGVHANLVIVSDHGMAEVSAAQVIRMPTVAPPDSYRLVHNGPFTGLAPQPGQDAVLAAALLRPHPHMQCWRKQAMPARFKFGSHARVPPYICLAEMGWQIRPADDGTPRKYAGNHGYDNQAPEMQALFLAHGPAFRAGVVLGSIDSVDVHPLLMHLLGLPARPVDGSAAATANALR